jgi:hypothetical protein
MVKWLQRLTARIVCHTKLREVWEYDEMNRIVNKYLWDAFFMKTSSLSISLRRAQSKNQVFCIAISLSIYIYLSTYLSIYICFYLFSSISPGTQDWKNVRHTGMKEFWKPCLGVVISAYLKFSSHWN